MMEKIVDKIDEMRLGKAQAQGKKIGMQDHH